MPVATFPEIFDLPPQLTAFHDLVDTGLAAELRTLNQPAAFPRTRENDQKHPIIQRFYGVYNRPPYHDKMNPLQRAYVRIVRHIADEMGFQGSTFYQAVPSCRVQVPNDLAVGEWHTDADYGHSPDEVNLFMPLGATNEHNTIHIEYEGMRKAYPLKRGQVLAFMGARWKHGNVLNTSNAGRVSFDFRLLHSSRYAKGGVTINGIRTFELGSYWNEIYL